MKTNIQSNPIIAFIAIIIICSVLVPAFVFAKANVLLSSSQINVTEGQRFTVSVNISAIDETIYTSKVALSYSSDVLEATSFTGASGWLSLSQPGYDSMDSVTGSIIKTGGYPTGLTAGTNKMFGTITFVAKKTGIATIKTTEATAIYDSVNNNIFVDTQTPVTITISEAVFTPETTDTENATGTATSTDIASSTIGQGAVAGLAKTTVPLYVVILIIIALGVVWGGYNYYNKNK